MAEHEKILFFVNKPYGYDNLARFRYGPNWEKALNPCEPIGDKEMCIGIIENSVLKASRLMVTDKDREIIRVTAPETGDTKDLFLQGKSGFIILEPDACNKEFIKDTVANLLDSNGDRHDYVHVAKVKDIENAGWIAYWAPIQLDGRMRTAKIPHVRIIAKRTILTGEDPTINDVESLKEVFRVIPNLHG